MDGRQQRGPARLPEVVRDALQTYAARATWPAGFAIYERDTEADGVFLVVRGRVVLRSRVRAGRGFVPWIATPGETFGGEGLAALGGRPGRYVTDARADEETETLFLSAARFRAFVREQPQVALALVAHLMHERTALLDKLRELTTCSVEQRLVAALQRLAASDTFVRSDGALALDPARYRLLCELVGATRESVALVVGRLVGAGVIERKGSSIIVPEPRRLAERISDAAPADLLLALDDAPGLSA